MESVEGVDCLKEELQERPAEQGAVCSELTLRVWGVTAPQLGAVLFYGGKSHDSLWQGKKIAAALGFNGNSNISRMVYYIVFFFPKLQVKHPKDNN